MHHYWGYGLLIESELEFPELLPYEFETPDVTISLGKTPEALIGEDVVHRVRVSISPKEYLLKTLNIANYYAANGNEIIVEPLPEGDEKSVRLFFLSNAMPAILHQRNLIPLHASGVFYKDGVALFCGKSGAGKSTLITALQQKGFTIFSDDVCVLQQQANTIITAVPSYPMIKLWQDSFEKTGMVMAEESERIRPQLLKYAKFFHSDFTTQPMPVKFVFSLEKMLQATNVKLTKLNNIAAFKEIQANTYRPLQTVAMQKRQEHFSMTSQLTACAEIFKLIRPMDGNTIEKVIALITEHLA